MNLKDILEYNFINIGDYHFNLLNIIEIFLVLLVARLMLWFVGKIFLQRLFTRKKVDLGRQFAITKFIHYIIYTFAILWAIQTAGVNLSLLWAGSAALLVGVGLGLQATFTDLISGLILLIEGSVEINDIVYVDGTIGIVRDISFRTSKVETRDRTVLIVPNSKLIAESVINWSHNADLTRFGVNVGVAYASNTEKVRDLLLQAAQEHTSILKEPGPQVQFIDFGNSSLDFRLYFFSEELMGIEQVKSQLRFRINQLFKENNVEIPFPQRDLWVRTNGEKGVPISLIQDELTR